MLRLAAQMLRFRKGSFLATFVALAAGVMILTACGLLVESGLRYQSTPERYANALAVVTVDTLTVAGPEMFGETESSKLPLPEGGGVPESLAGPVAAVPGVAAAVADRSIVLPGATGHGWASAALTPYRMVSGTSPRTDGEVVVGAGRGQVGEPVTLLVGGTAHRFRISGTITADSAAPAVYFTDAAAARLDPHPGRLAAIGVLAEPGADRAAVLRAVRAVAAEAGATAYAGADRGLAEEPAAATGRQIAIEAGSAFGGYAALIIAFVVAGTVGLSVRHRRRDLALLRAIAATPGQVRRMILGEVAILGALAAAVGVPAGLFATGWVRGQLVTRGFLPESFTVRGGPLSALAATAAVVAVALIAAWIAARRTTRIRPTEALGEAAVEPVLGGRVRVVSGLVFLALAVSLIGLTSATGGQTALGAAVSMLYSFVLAVTLLAPWINATAARLLAPVLRAVWGSGGYLAAANLRANARGMVAVLTALVLSVGFGGTVWFLQDNLQRQTVVQSRDGLRAEQALTSPAGLPAAAAAQARRLPGVLAATGVRHTSVIVPTGIEPVAVPAQGVDPQDVDQTLDLGVRRGKLADLRDGTMAVSTAQADSAGWDLGDTAPVWLGDGTPVSLRIIAVYDRGFGFGDVTLARDTLAGHTRTGLDDQVLLRTEPGADLSTLTSAYPGSTLLSTDRLTGELARDLAVSAWLNRLLIAVLVGYAVLAAANTLVIAALARSRELSLLRLVGVTRGQVRRMVQAEQAGLLGVALTIGTAIAAITLSSVVNAVTGQRLPYVPGPGIAVIIGGTIALALLATMLPIGRLLRTPPIDGIGLRE